LLRSATSRTDIADSCAIFEQDVEPVPHSSAQRRATTLRCPPTGDSRSPDAPSARERRHRDLVATFFRTRPPPRTVSNRRATGHNGIVIYPAGLGASPTPPSWPRQRLLTRALALALALALPLSHIIPDLAQPLAESQRLAGKRGALAYPGSPTRQQPHSIPRELERPSTNQRPSTVRVERAVEDRVHTRGEVVTIALGCQFRRRRRVRASGCFTVEVTLPFALASPPRPLGAAFEVYGASAPVHPKVAVTARGGVE
jgi:hypothetical protein